MINFNAHFSSIDNTNEAHRGIEPGIPDKHIPDISIFTNLLTNFNYCDNVSILITIHKI